MELDREVAHDLVVLVVLVLLAHLVEALEHFKAVLEVHDLLEVLEGHDLLEVLEGHDLLRAEEVQEVHDLPKAEEVLEVHDLLEVLEGHDLLKAEEVEGGLVERSQSNSALLLHLVEFLDLCHEAAAQEVLSASVESVQQMVSVMQPVRLKQQPRKNFAFLLPT